MSDDLRFAKSHLNNLPRRWRVANILFSQAGSNLFFFCNCSYFLPFLTVIFRTTPSARALSLYCFFHFLSWLRRVTGEAGYGEMGTATKTLPVDFSTSYYRPGNERYPAAIWLLVIGILNLAHVKEKRSRFESSSSRSPGVAVLDRTIHKPSMRICNRYWTSNNDVVRNALVRITAHTRILPSYYFALRTRKRIRLAWILADR